MSQFSPLFVIYITNYLAMKHLLVTLISLATFALSASAQLTEQQQIQKLNLVYQHIRNHYVDDVSLEPLVDEAIKATLKELDPHSTYLTKEQMTNLRTRIRGEYAGIGIKYIMHHDTIVVRSVTERSPAERAKIKINDRIIAIDGKSIVGLTTDSIATLFRGAKNTNAMLSIARRSESKPLDINISRDIIESSAISSAFRIGNVGYISSSAFSKPLAQEFYKAYKKLGGISCLIIDLRDNGGGAITAAIDLTGIFLKKGDVIVSTEGRTNSIVYDKKKDGAILDLPIVVMINENSASASEIFAGAIQDHDRGVVVGRTSFGKGLVQKVIDLKDGSGVCLTTDRYKTPSGRIIQRPYTMGKGEEYQADSMRFVHPDSIAHDPKLMFTTLKRGRKVYGGGGITPDIYTEDKTLEISKKLIELYSKAIFEHTTIEIWDRVLLNNLHKQYPTADDFAANFVVNSDIMELFYMSSDSAESDFTAIDIEFISTMIKATMAEQLYGEWARYYIYCQEYDSTLQRALEIATTPALYNGVLCNEGK